MDYSMLDMADMGDYSQEQTGYPMTSLGASDLDQATLSADVEWYNFSNNLPTTMSEGILHGQI